MSSPKPVSLWVAVAIAAGGIIWFIPRFYEVYSAERAFEIADAANQGGDACRAANAVAAIHLKRGNEQSYKDWSNRALVTCYNAKSN